MLRPVSLESVLHSALHDLRDVIRETQAVVEVQSDLPSVIAHSATLGQIATNLISNAIKFAAPGERPRVEVTCEQSEVHVRLLVQDSGIGIAPEHHQRIFKVFERLHGVETYSGTGIGLAIVNRAAQRLSGRCGVQSECGKGSLFWVELPRMSGEP